MDWRVPAIVLATACGGTTAREQGAAQDGGSGPAGDSGTLAQSDSPDTCIPSSGFAQRFGDSQRQYATDLALGDEQLVLGGFFEGTLGFSGSPLVGAGGWDLFVARFSTTGEPLSSFRIGSDAYEYGTSIAIGPAGTVAVSGSLTQAMDFGDGIVGGAFDDFVASYDQKNGLRWVHTLPGINVAATIANPDGTVLAFGSLGDVAHQIDPTIPAPTGSDDAFAVAIANDGTELWQRLFVDDGAGIIHDAARTSDGDVVIVGTFEGNLMLGPDSQLSSEKTASFAARLTSTGDVLWSRTLTSAWPVYALRVDVGLDGTIGVTGTPDAPSVDGLNWGGVYVAALDAEDGSERWVKSAAAGIPGYKSVEGVTVAPDGGIVATIYFQDSSSLFGFQLTSAGDGDIALVRFDSDGGLSSVRQFGDGADQNAARPVLLPDGRVVLAGSFEGRLELGGCPLESAGDFDVFLATVDP